MQPNGADPTNGVAALVLTPPDPPPPKAVRKRRQRLATESSGQVIPDLALWAQGARLGGGLSPSRISQIIREGDTGYTRRLMDLANECRQQDAHLQAVLATQEESIAGLPWQVVPSSDKPRAKDKKAAQWVEDRLRAHPGMTRLLSDLAGAIYYAFAVVEILWKREGAQLVPDHFSLIAPRRFRFRIEDGVFIFHDISTGGDPVDFLALYPNKFIVSRPRVTGDNAHREGLCRVLVWMSAMRKWAIGDWLSTAEMSWKPWRIGQYKKGTSGVEDRETLETVLRRLTTDGAAVIPDSCEIKIEWPSGTGSKSSTHAELTTALANEMSKAVLGQTETTQASTSSGYAQAKVHDTVRRDLREARARQVASDITRDLVTPMIRLNFGDTVEIPRFEFVTQDQIDLAPFSAAMLDLRKAGARIPQKWLFDQIGIPEPKPGDEIVGENPNAPNVSGHTPAGQKPAAGGGDAPVPPLDQGATTAG